VSGAFRQKWQDRLPTAKIFKVHFSRSAGFFIIPDFRVPDLWGSTVFHLRRLCLGRILKKKHECDLHPQNCKCSLSFWYQSTFGFPYAGHSLDKLRMHCHLRSSSSPTERYQFSNTMANIILNKWYNFPLTVYFYSFLTGEQLNVPYSPAEQRQTQQPTISWHSQPNCQFEKHFWNFLNFYFESEGQECHFQLPEYFGG
jgi:hypothetical protein